MRKPSWPHSVLQACEQAVLSCHMSLGPEPFPRRLTESGAHRGGGHASVFGGHGVGEMVPVRQCQVSMPSSFEDRRTGWCWKGVPRDTPCPPHTPSSLLHSATRGPTHTRETHRAGGGHRARVSVSHVPSRVYLCCSQPSGSGQGKVPGSFLLPPPPPVARPVPLPMPDSKSTSSAPDGVAVTPPSPCKWTMNPSKRASERTAHRPGRQSSPGLARRSGTPRARPGLGRARQHPHPLPTRCSQPGPLARAPGGSGGSAGGTQAGVLAGVGGGDAPPCHLHA